MRQILHIKCSEEQYKNFCNSKAFAAFIDFCKNHAVILDVEFPEAEIRDGSGCSILEPRSARELALEWLNRKAERKGWYGRRNGIDKMQ